MKFTLRLIYSVLAAFSLLSGQINYQTFTTMQVGPGVIFKKMVAPQLPWTLNVIEVDLTNPYITIESVKAQNQLEGYERTSSMAARNSYAGHRVVGAVNADFYGTGGVPINIQIVNGQMVRSVNWNNKSTLATDVLNRPNIRVTSYYGFLLTNTGGTTINAVNQTRETNFMVLYNSYKGSSTGTNQWGTEVLIRPVDDWIVNDTIHCIVEAKQISVGSMAIPSGKAVLSGHGGAGTFLTNNVQIGDTVRLYLGVAPGFPRLNQLVGGFPKIVQNGVNHATQGYADEGGSSDFSSARHPRTAVGFSADSTKLYLITVDGRQTISVGMSLPELANFMLTRGVAHAVNLDGGGSTTIVVQGAIENSPSDGWERSVANALLVVSSAPQDTAAIVQLRPDVVSCYKGRRVDFITTGWDQYYNPVTINLSDVNYSTSPGLGEISADGRFTAGYADPDGYVYAQFKHSIDSALVRIIRFQSIELYPPSIMTDTSTTVQLTVKVINENGGQETIDPLVFSWQCLDPSVGTVDDAGLFTPLAIGEARVVISYGAQTDTSVVYVEVGDDWAQIDLLDEIGLWSLSGSNYDTQMTSLSVVDTPRTAGEKAFRLDYQFVRVSNEETWINLDNHFRVYGIPTEYYIDFFSNGLNHRLYLVVRDNDGSLFWAKTRSYANQGGVYTRQIFEAAKFLPLTSDTKIDYPLHIESIRLKLGYNADAGQINSGTVFYDNLRLIYPNFTSVIPGTRDRLPARIRLLPNYPNPFNPATHIRFETPVSGPALLRIFNLNGELIDTLLDEPVAAGLHTVIWRAADYSSGIYFYQLQLGTICEKRKCILLK